MTGASQGLALNFGELTLPIECLDKKTEQRLRAQLKQGAAKRVTLVPAPNDDQDVEGHTFAGSLRSVLVHVRVGDSNRAQAVRVHFPTTEDADHFRRNLIAAGLLAGSLALGSIGVASLSNTGTGAGAGATQLSGQVADESGSVGTAHGYYVQEGSAGTAHGYFLQEEGAGSQGTAHGYFMEEQAVTGSQGTAHGYFQQAAPTAADESVVAGSQYSGKAAIGESLGLQGTASPSDELAAQVTDGWAASMPAAPTSDELAAQVTDGWAASGVGSQAAVDESIPASQGTAHGYFQQTNAASDEESTLPPGNPYSGKAAVDESLK